jgi:hypothetical protein
MDFFFEILAATPWWVYCLFVYLLVIGIKALKEQVVSFPKVFFLPAGLTVWSISSLVLRGDLVASVVWATAIGVGICSGWLKNRAMVVLDVKENAMTIPGHRSTLVMLLVLFFAKYILVVFEEINGHVYFTYGNIAVSALASGFFLGKVVSLRNKYEKSISSA